MCDAALEHDEWCESGTKQLCRTISDTDIVAAKYDDAICAFRFLVQMMILPDPFREAFDFVHGLSHRNGVDK